MDRLSELRAKRAADAPSTGRDSKAAAVEMASGDDDDYVKEFDKVKKRIDTIKGLTDRVKELKKKSDIQVRDADEKVVMAELDDIMAQVKGEASAAKAALDKLDADVKKYQKDNPSSTTAQIRANLLSTNTRSFSTAMTDYQSATEAFRDAMKQRVKRQAKILKDDITDEQIEEVVNSKNPGEFLKQAMGLEDVMVDAVVELEERHERMRHIEQGIREIHELFQDLAILVEVQGEQLDNIEKNVYQTRDYTKKGEENLLAAEKSQTRNRKCLCCVIGLGLAAVIALILGLSLTLPGL